MVWRVCIIVNFGVFEWEIQFSVFIPIRFFFVAVVMTSTQLKPSRF